MAKITVIGATGHIGTYLVPRLVRGGHDVTVVTRGQSRPYHADPAWESVRRVTLDREAGDRDATFGPAIADLGSDVVIDLVCFTEASARSLVEALKGRAGLLVECGTIWVHGPARAVPQREDDPRAPFGDYGTNKDALERYVLAQDDVPAIVCHPGHISGPGWVPINPLGNLDLGVWQKLAAGDEVLVPGFGMETLNHVHADDVAQAFELAAAHPEHAGQGYHVVAERSWSVRGLCEAGAGWFGRGPDLRFVGWDEFAASAGEHADVTYEHIARSPACSIAKAQRDLGYAPRFDSADTLREAVAWLEEDGQISFGDQTLNPS